MKNLENIEKIINSELTTKIKNSEIKHDQIYLSIDDKDLIDVVLFLKTNLNTKYKQLIDITAVDYPEKDNRFKLVYLFLSHEINQRIIINFFVKENELLLRL
jgi:NADH:ubiquinone oxidoreductase 27 kD subunit